MQLLHCTSTASSMQVQTPDSRTQRVFVSGALFGTVLAFFAGKTCDASLAALPPRHLFSLFSSHRARRLCRESRATRGELCGCFRFSRNY